MSLVQWTQNRRDVIELVGPKGYIHGWIKVGADVTHKDGSKGLVTKYDPNTQTAHVDWKSGPRVGKANKTTTKAYHLVRPSEDAPKTPEKAPEAPKTVPTTHTLTSDQLEAYAQHRIAGKSHQDALDAVTRPVAPKAPDKPASKPASKPQTHAQEVTDQLTEHPDLVSNQDSLTLRKVDEELTKRSKPYAEGLYDSDLHAAVRAEIAKRAKPAESMRAYHVKAPKVFGDADAATLKQHQATIDRVVAEGPARVPQLGTVRVMREDDDEGMGGKALADYRSGISGSIRVRSNRHSSASTAQHQNMIRSGWFAHAEQMQNSAHAVLTHEYGHHLDASLPRDARAKMVGDVMASLGHPQKIIGTVVDSRLSPKEQASVVSHVSTYASANKHELIAELYTEGTLSKNPSKAAQIVRQTMLDQFGGK